MYLGRYAGRLGLTLPDAGGPAQVWQADDSGDIWNATGGTGGSDAAIFGTALAMVPGIGPIASIGTQIGNLIKTAISSIGSGRKEADRIVPVQNQLMAMVAQIIQVYPTSRSISDLQSMLSLLQQNWNKFQQFVGNRGAFPDGRASQQALNDVGPYVRSLQGSLIQRITDLGGGTQPMMLTQGPGVPSLQFPTMGIPGLPQSGTLAVGWNQPSGSVFNQGVSSGVSLMPVFAAGALAYLFFRKKR